jgi:hypothetical protein
MVEFARSHEITAEEKAEFGREMHDLFEPIRNARLKDIDVGYILRSGLSSLAA